jgi:NADPH:quinone reductase-like Zn-dependent oxidoreductase
VTSRSQAKRDRAKTLGADHTIDYEAVPLWGAEALAWTAGRGVDVVVEVGGAGTFDQSVGALRFSGTMSLIGVLTGARGEVSTAGVFHKALHIRGIYVGSRRMFESLNRALAVTQIRPIIDRVFDWEDIRPAYEYLASGAHFGKVVIRVH